MSYKAYVFRLRTEQDVDDLDKYINKSGMDGVAFFEFFYIPKKSFQRFRVKDTDLVAAITVDRGNLYESLKEEGGIDGYHCRLDDLPRYALKRIGEDCDTRVEGWDVPPDPTKEWVKKGWAAWAKDYLHKKVIHEYTTKGGVPFEYGFIAKPSDMAGRLEPFRPCWNIQCSGDGTQAFFDTEEECLAWADEWDQICN